MNGHRILAPKLDHEEMASAVTITSSRYGASGNGFISRYVPEIDIDGPISYYSIFDAVKANATAGDYNGYVGQSAYVSSTSNSECVFGRWSNAVNKCLQHRYDNSSSGSTLAYDLPTSPSIMHCEFNSAANTSFVKMNGSTITTSTRYGTFLARSTRRFRSNWSYFTIAVTGTLSERDLALLAENPWSLIAPQVRYVHVGTAAAASTYTLSSATWVPGSITATGVTPRVTVTVA
jgi:hypothetical protein